MNNYLAKSYPKETIEEHTLNLLKNYEIFKTIYPNLELDWDILYLACLYHDLGKMNRKFQEKIEKIKRHDNEIPHGILSTAFINSKKLEKQGYTKKQIKILAHSIAYHHERDFDIDMDVINSEIELLKTEVQNFYMEQLEDLKVKKLSIKYFDNTRIEEKDEELFFEYTKVKGLLNRIDYAASGGIVVEKKNDFLIHNLEENLMANFKKENPNSDWNALQKFMIEHRDHNVVVTAQTGMGKTEAGLLWIGDNKGFFTLPLKTAINAMYKRIIEKIVTDDFQNKVGLLHSDMKREYMNLYDEHNDHNKKNQIEFDEYYDKTKQLSLPLTICTMDQLFRFVYRYRGFEPLLATLSYAKIVIDEVQMYSPELLSYLVIGLYYINKIGGKFAVLTATLPQLFVDLLKEQGISFKESTFTDHRIRHSVQVIKDQLNTSFVKDKYENNKVLVICNTVKEAQRVYEELLLDEKIKGDIHLFHSGFIRKDRKRKEDEILEFGKKEEFHKENRNQGIWVTTQVVEASLDIDFDVLITELSDLNGLFQRMGRCFRSRDWEGTGYNCFVFDGGKDKTSGIGPVVDKEVFAISKEILHQIDGKITEQEKVEMINQVYTTDRLRETEYYKKLKDSIKYVTRIEANEKSKTETNDLFRKIESMNVIPRSIYEQSKESVHQYMNILSKKYTENMNKEQRQALKKEKLNARLNLEDLFVPVSTKRINNNLESIKINEYEYLNILDCEYDENIGIQFIDRKSHDLTTEDRFFE